MIEMMHNWQAVFFFSFLQLLVAAAILLFFEIDSVTVVCCFLFLRCGACAIGTQLTAFLTHS